jgi:hypothetical protein
MKRVGPVANEIVRGVQDHPASGGGSDGDSDRRTLLDRWLFALAVAGDGEIDRSGLAAAIVILESRDKRTDVYVCGYGKIAKHGAMHRSTAIHAVNKLVERGWFQKLSGGLGKAGELLPNRYLPQWSRLG